MRYSDERRCGALLSKSKRPRRITGLQGRVSTEAAGGVPEERASARIFAELRHGDTAKGQRLRIVAQADALERTERIADRGGARGGGDQRVHRDLPLRDGRPNSHLR